MTAISGPLLTWYHQTGRDLPWRKTTDPYAIWVSEIMLQQTQVVTVIPYYHTFLSVFPAIKSLAAAPIDHVLKIWQGLGYYTRARNLYHAAKTIMDQFGGVFPSTQKELLSLPGIGRSTAGAILNIAFLQKHPILDGNVKRILIRYFCIEKDPKEKKVDEKLWQLAEQILPDREVNHFTQAIMDLGATVCLPKNPKCAICPVQPGCQAHQKGLQDELPMKPVRKEIPHYDYIATVIQRGNRVLIRKRPEKGLLGGLWEFPGGRVEQKDHFNEVMQNEVKQKVVLTPRWFYIQHAFTHFKMTLHLFRGSIEKARVSVPFKWVTVNQLADYPFSAAHQKIVLKLQEEM
jgi:A/G-specific adenine glycosylase